jgi:hypothetical protein
MIERLLFFVILYLTSGLWGPSVIEGTKSITTAIQRSIDSRMVPRFELAPEKTPIFFDDLDKMNLGRSLGVRRTDEVVVMTDIQEIVDSL